MNTFNQENEKFINIKPKYFSNYSKYKHILSFNKNIKSNSMNDIINRMYLKKNINNNTPKKKLLLKENLSIPLIHSNELSLGKTKNEDKVIQRYYMNEKIIFKHLLKRFTRFKESNNSKNISFTNNFINSKINQYEENLKFNRSKILSNASISFWNQKEEENNDFIFSNNVNKKNNMCSTHKTNINIKDNSIDKDDVYKIKITNVKNKGFNKVLNKYISNNIINNLKSFNKIRHLIKINGFSLNINDVKKIYKENDAKHENEIQNCRIDTQSMMRIKKLENIEKLKKEKYDIYMNKEKEKEKEKEKDKDKENAEAVNKTISRNKILPLIKSEMKERPNKLRIILNLLNNKNEIKNYKLFHREIMIKREVNKYYTDNKYKSFEDFYNDWLKNNKNYLTINDIEFFLNKIIKISIPITREEIIKMFFNNNIKIDQFDYFNFKKFFRPYDFFYKKDDVNIKGKNISNEELINYESKICSKLLDSKEILLIKLQGKGGSRTIRYSNKYFFNFDEFYTFIKENLIIDQNNYFDIVMRKIYNDNFDLRTNKINLVDFLNKLDIEKNNMMEFENKINNSDIINSLQNHTRRKFLHRINSFKNSRIIVKKTSIDKEELFNNSESKITDFIKLDKISFNKVNNKGENNINNITKLKNIQLESDNNRRRKNSDIINLI